MKPVKVKRRVNRPAQLHLSSFTALVSLTFFSTVPLNLVIDFGHPQRKWILKSKYIYVYLSWRNWWNCKVLTTKLSDYALTWFDELFCMSDDNNSGNSHQIDFSEQGKTRQISVMLRICTDLGPAQIGKSRKIRAIHRRSKWVIYHQWKYLLTYLWPYYNINGQEEDVFFERSTEIKHIVNWYERWILEQHRLKN